MTKTTQWIGYVAAGWSALFTVMALVWTAGGPGYPWVDDGLLVHASRGITAPIAVFAGALGTIAAIAMARRKSRWFAAYGGVAVVALAALIDSRVLTSLGYTVPVAIGKLFGWHASAGNPFAKLYPWPVQFQLWCVVGIVLWFGTTLTFLRIKRNACPSCGRAHSGETHWTTPAAAAKWGRTAAYLSMVPPCLYAAERLSWALGFPLGGSPELVAMLRESGGWVAGLGLASMALFGVLMTFGLVRRWGEIFPFWLPGLAGRRVPIGFPVTCFLVVSVALVAATPDLVGALAEGGPAGTIGTPNGFLGIVTMMILPLWGVAMIVATAGYYLRRRGRCRECGQSSTVMA
jgi:hypothetical protein